jgi:hypothetical protein
MPMFRDRTWGPKYGLRKAVNQVNGTQKDMGNGHNTGFSGMARRGSEIPSLFHSFRLPARGPRTPVHWATSPCLPKKDNSQGSGVVRDHAPLTELLVPHEYSDHQMLRAEQRASFSMWINKGASG